MARGRFIAKEICIDKTVNDLNDPWSMLAFTWLVTHADCEGRTYGDPAIVKSLVFPRRTDITIEQIESFIQEWNVKGLIILYEADGDKFIQFPNFDKHQPGLNKTKETASHIPIPEQIQSKDGVTQDLGGVKLSRSKVEVKLSLSQSQSEVEVEGNQPDNSNNYQLGELATIFSELTHIEPDHRIKEWQEAEYRLIKAGVTEDDLTMAIVEMQRKPEYKIISLKSIVTPAIQCQSKRAGREIARITQ